MAAMTEAQKKAQAKYRKEGTKLITVQCPVDEWEEIDTYCKKTGEGKSTMIKRLIHEEMQLHPNGRI